MGLPERRDRSTPAPIVRAAVSPVPWVAGAAGTGVALLLSTPLLPAVLTGFVVWAIALLVYAFRHAATPGASRMVADRIDPFAVGEPWRQFVKEAVTARNRFDEAVARTPEGPLHDRLGDIGSRVTEGVDEVWRIAGHGNALSRARTDLGPGQLRRRLEHTRRLIQEGDTSHEATVDALQAQLSSVDRIETTIADTEVRLRTLNARLAEAVARGIELSVQAAGAVALDAIGDDVEGVVGELEALRQALEETNGGSAGSPP
jgi:hypothetical protein